uniref:DNA primase n=1 Tax=Aureoumbra lagunensis TaxID=44058 RepID=A0A7S3JXH2_9STRA
MCGWLGYEEGGNSLLSKREFVFTLEDEVWCRYKSFRDAVELKSAMLKEMPRKIDLGAIYNVSPIEHKVASNFKPQIRELVFDIDLSDYDDVRTCCQGATVCRRCWRFVAAAVTVTDTCLKEDFGFTHRLWVYSGRRGVHCWVADKMARELTNEARTAVINYCSVSRKSDASCGDDLSWPMHPSLQRAYDILEPIFEQDIISGGHGQGHLAEPELWTQLLQNCNLPTDIAQQIAEHWSSHTSTPIAKFHGLKELIVDAKTAPKLYNTSTFALNNKKSKVANSDQIANKLWKYNLIFKYIYPRLDENVSKQRNHLLKAPFAVHPKTGRICIPFDPDKVDDFDPELVPTLRDLAEQIDAAEDPSAPDLDKTSLKSHVDFFQNSFLKPLQDSLARERRNKNRQQADQNAATQLDF